MTSLNGMATIPADHPLYGGVVGEYGADGANRILLRADVVLVAGASLGSMTTWTWSLIPPDAQVIQVDLDAAEIGRNFEVAVPLAGDVGAVLGQLATAAGSAHALAGWAREAAAIRDDWRAEVDASETSDAVPIRPERLFRMVGDGDGRPTRSRSATPATPPPGRARHLRLSGRAVRRPRGRLARLGPARLARREERLPRPRGRLRDRRRRVLLPHQPSWRPPGGTA